MEKEEEGDRLGRGRSSIDRRWTRHQINLQEKKGARSSASQLRKTDPSVSNRVGNSTEKRRRVDYGGTKGKRNNGSSWEGVKKGFCIEERKGVPGPREWAERGKTGGSLWGVATFFRGSGKSHGEASHLLLKRKVLLLLKRKKSLV